MTEIREKDRFLVLRNGEVWEVVAIRGFQACLWSGKHLQFRVEDTQIIVTAVNKGQWIFVEREDWNVLEEQAHR